MKEYAMKEGTWKFITIGPHFCLLFVRILLAWHYLVVFVSAVQSYWNWNFRLSPSLVGRSVGWSVCHNFLTGREVSLPRSYRNTCSYKPGSRAMYLQLVNHNPRILGKALHHHHKQLFINSMLLWRKQPSLNLQSCSRGRFLFRKFCYSFLL